MEDDPKDSNEYFDSLTDKALKKLSEIRDEWTTTERPNSELDDYNLDDIAAAINEIDVLLKSPSLDRSKLAEDILARLILPPLSSSAAEYAWLKTYWQLTKIQEALAVIAYSKEMPSERIHKEDHIGTIKEISLKIDHIKSEIEELRKDKDPFGRISVSVLGVSAPINTIYKSVSQASILIKSKNIDAHSLTRNLEIAYREAKSIWKTAVGFAHQLSKKTIGLLEEILTTTGAALRQSLGLTIEQRKKILTTVSLSIENGSKADLAEIRKEMKAIYYKSNEDGVVTKSTLAKALALFSQCSFALSASDSDDAYYTVRPSEIIQFLENRITILVFPLGIAGGSGQEQTSGKVTEIRSFEYLTILDKFIDEVNARLQMTPSCMICVSRFEPAIFLEKRTASFDESSIWKS